MNPMFEYLRANLTDDRSIEEVLRSFARSIPYVEDARDYTHDQRPTEKTGVDYSRWVGNIENQKTLPICVAQASEVIARVHTNRSRNTDDTIRVRMSDFDAQGLYNWIKANDGFPGVQGTIPRYGMKALHKEGIKELYPDRKHTFKLMKYWRCRDVKDVINALLTVGPVKACFKCHESMFYSNGVLETPKQDEPLYGYHDMAITGYKEGVLSGVNSWGWTWGDYGHFKVSAEVYDTLVTESWCGI